MIPTNSPSGQNDDELSSFHKNSPNPDILRMYLEEYDHPATPPIHPLLKDLITNIKDKVVLDVGCGLGSVFCQGLLYYGLNSKKIYSLDPDKKNFRIDQYPRVHKIVGYTEDIKCKSNFFDVVHSNEMTFDNLTIDYIQSLKEINRVLKPNGFYLASEGFDFITEIRKTNPRVGIKSQDPSSIINDDKLIDKLGFKPIVKIKYLASPTINPNLFLFYLFQKKVI